MRIVNTKIDMQLVLSIEYTIKVKYDGDNSVLEVIETHEDTVPDETLQRTAVLFALTNTKVEIVGKSLHMTILGTEYMITKGILKEFEEQLKYLTPNPIPYVPTSMFSDKDLKVK